MTLSFSSPILFSVIMSCCHRLRRFLVFAAISGALTLQAHASFQQQIELVDFEGVASGRQEREEINAMWTWNNIKTHLVGGSNEGTPAVAKIEIPEDGTYYVWVAHAVHPIRSRTFFIDIAGIAHPYAWTPAGEFAEQGSEHYPPTNADIGYMVWTKQEFVIGKGPQDLTLTTEGLLPIKAVRHPAVVQRVIITDDPDYTPSPEDLR